MNLFDASALLCMVQRELGAQTVRRELLVGGACSVVNWSEVAQKCLASGRDWALAGGGLLGYGLRIEPVDVDDAALAARMWLTKPHLSLADRICLATADRLGAVVWTTDPAWGTDDPVRQVR